MDHVLPEDVEMYRKYVRTDKTKKGIILHQGDLSIETPVALIIQKICFILKYCSGLFDAVLESDPNPLYAEEFFMLIDNECNVPGDASIFFGYAQMEKLWNSVLTETQRCQVIHRICHEFYPVNEEDVRDLDEQNLNDSPLNFFQSPTEFREFKDVWNQILTDHDFHEDMFHYEVLGVFTQLLLYSRDFVKYFFRNTSPFTEKDIIFSTDQMIRVWDEILETQQKEAIIHRLNGKVYDDYRWFD